MDQPNISSILKRIELQDELNRLYETKRIAESKRGEGFQETMNLVSLDSMIRETEGRIKRINGQAVLEFELYSQRAGKVNGGEILYSVNGNEYSAVLLSDKKIKITLK